MFRSLKSEAEQLLLPSTYEVSSGLQEHLMAMTNRDEIHSYLPASSQPSLQKCDY